jgi:acetyl-CoA C-acetyltransferase
MEDSKLGSRSDVFVFAARRTPVGSYLGGLSSLQAHDLGKIVISDIMKSHSIPSTQIDEVILGQVLTGGACQNPARQSAINAGLGVNTPAFTLNKVCGSGLKAIAIGCDSIKLGNASLVLAGGQESMSCAMHSVLMRANQHFATKLGDSKLIDMMVYDGLTDAFSKTHMGITAENVAKQFHITRAEQDEFALASQQKASIALSEGRFDNEIVPVEIASRKETIIISKDEFIKPQTTLDGLAKLKPAFDKDGTVTAGNASGINDGAAVLLLGSEEAGNLYGLSPIARVVSHASYGVEPHIMGIGPSVAIPKAIHKAGWTIDMVDLFEANEAFASQAIAVNRILEVDTSRVNVNGGAIAIGHPIGASGARIVVTLLHEMQKRSAKRGVAGLCIGGGMGIAMCFELV